MKSLLIIGAGGHGKVVAEIAEDLGYKKIDFLDDNAPEAIGKIGDIEKYIDYGEAFCGIGNNKIREDIIQKIKKAGYTLATLVHPSAYISRSVKIGQGTVIEPRAMINTNSIIGEGTIISLGSLIDHDVVIGKYAHINSGAIVKAGGNVSNYEKLEAGEVVLGYETAVVRKE